MPKEEDLRFHVEHHQEERYLEYKASMMWTRNDITKVEITKAMMAMSNLRDGGIIIVGMKEIRRGVWEPDNMTEDQTASFNHDDIASWVNNYAIPAVQFTSEPFILGKNQFVIIQVREFESIPTICRKPKLLRGIEVLKNGAIYYRSNRKNESAPISCEEDMRELIELTVSKSVSRQINRMEELGLIVNKAELQERSTLKYEQEREGL